MNLLAIRQFVELLEQEGVNKATEFVVKQCLPAAKAENISLYQAALKQSDGNGHHMPDLKMKKVLKNKAFKNLDIHQPL